MPELNWKEAEKYLKEMRQAYIDIGSAGLLGLNFVIKPLIARFEMGERTKNLYNEIMSLE